MNNSLQDEVEDHDTAGDYFVETLEQVTFTRYMCSNEFYSKLHRHVKKYRKSYRVEPVTIIFVLHFEEIKFDN